MALFLPCLYETGDPKSTLCLNVLPISKSSHYHDHATMGNERLKSFSKPTAMWAQHKKENLLVTSAELSRAPGCSSTTENEHTDRAHSSTQPRKQEDRPLTQPQLSDVALKHINHRDTSLIKILPCSSLQSLSPKRPKLWFKRNTCLNKISHSYSPASPWLSNSSK